MDSLFALLKASDVFFLFSPDGNFSSANCGEHGMRMLDSKKRRKKKKKQREGPEPACAVAITAKFAFLKCKNVSPHLSC